jgi:cell shape-determining protein MreC
VHLTERLQEQACNLQASLRSEAQLKVENQSLREICDKQKAGLDDADQPAPVTIGREEVKKDVCIKSVHSAFYNNNTII